MALDYRVKQEPKRLCLFSALKGNLLHKRKTDGTIKIQWLRTRVQLLKLKRSLTGL